MIERVERKSERTGREGPRKRERRGRNRGFEKRVEWERERRGREKGRDGKQNGNGKREWEERIGRENREKE